MIAVGAHETIVTLISLGPFFGGQTGKYSEGIFADFTHIFTQIVLRILASPCCLREISVSSEIWSNTPSVEWRFCSRIFSIVKGNDAGSKGFRTHELQP